MKSIEFKKKRRGISSSDVRDGREILLDESLTKANKNCSTSSRSDNKETSIDRHNNNKTTDAQTMMHILKANIGTGVLAMPNAFKNVGLWTGFVLIPLIGAVCIHCMNILIQSQNHLCDKFNYESLDYDQVAALSLACGPKFARRLAKRAHIVVTIFLVVTQVGFCCVYIMFVVENIQLAILNLFNIEYSNTTYLLIIFPVIGLTSCTSNLKHLARISTLANLLQLAGLSLILFDLLQFHTYSQQQQQQQSDFVTSSNDTQTSYNNGTTSIVNPLSKPPQIEVNQFISGNIFSGLPLFFATAVYAFEGIGVVLPVIKEMQHPNRICGYNGVLNIAMSLVALLYMGIGFFGYSKYGQLVQASITLNLPETTLNDLVRFIFALAIGLSYSLQFYVPWTIIWPHIDESLFYSYRPRVPRDKLDILDKLSPENEWAIDLDEEFEGKTLDVEESGEKLVNSEQQQQQLDYNSTASTFATSYSVSTCLANSYQTSFARMQRKSMLSSASMRNNHQYGTIQASVTSGKQPLGVVGRRKRNRLDDLNEEEDSMPEVQWRPPPRSMRGKRKLVRYTVILLSVSFTFVAAALIPRLDLFISLIGALASSSLAIIFPAIIQTCTFWNPDEEINNQVDDDDEEEKLESARKLGSQLVQEDSIGNRYKKRRQSSSTSRFFFLLKNFLLVLFGILGLITGGWISLAQLGAIYMRIEPEMGK